MGAAFLVIGSVIIGRREEGKSVGAGSTESKITAAHQKFQDQDDGYIDYHDTPIPIVDGLADNDGIVLLERAPNGKRPRGNEVEGKGIERCDQRKWAELAWTSNALYTTISWLARSERSKELSWKPDFK